MIAGTVLSCHLGSALPVAEPHIFLESYTHKCTPPLTHPQILRMHTHTQMCAQAHTCNAHVYIQKACTHAHVQNACTHTHTHTHTVCAHAHIKKCMHTHRHTTNCKHSGCVTLQLQWRLSRPGTVQSLTCAKESLLASPVDLSLHMENVECHPRSRPMPLSSLKLN